MPTQPTASKICLRCGAIGLHLSVWYHPDFKEEQVVVWLAICSPCTAELEKNDLTALDVIAMELARGRYEKDYDYTE